MTDIINFFQSIFIFRNFSPLRVSTQEINLAILLKREARKFAAKADEEMQNGDTMRTLAFETEDKEKSQVFAKIAIWHNDRAAERFRQAAKSFDEAGRVQIEKSRAFNLMTREMANRAARAEASMKVLNDFLKQS